jgi:hypothetical protein
MNIMNIYFKNNILLKNTYEYSNVTASKTPGLSTLNVHLVILMHVVFLKVTHFCLCVSYLLVVLDIAMIGWTSTIIHITAYMIGWALNKSYYYLIVHFFLFIK